MARPVNAIWLRIPASFGLAGWLLVTTITAPIISLTLTSSAMENRRWLIVATMVPYMSAALLFPINAALANLLLGKLSAGTIAISPRQRLIGLVFSILGGLSNAAIVASSRYLMYEEQRFGGQAALLWMITTSALAVIGAPFLFVFLWRLGRTAPNDELSRGAL